MNRYRLRDWDHDSRREVDQPMASTLMLRRTALDDVGLFDEAFPLYFNDVDLCYRIRQAGGRIVFLPEAKVTHHHGHSTRQVRGAGRAGIASQPDALLSQALSRTRRLVRVRRGHGPAWLTMGPRAGAAWVRGRLTGA